MSNALLMSMAISAVHVVGCDWLNPSWISCVSSLCSKGVVFDPEAMHCG